MKTFAETIRELREQRQATDKTYSLRGVAARLRVSPSWLSKVERGIEVPSADTIKRLAGILDADAVELLVLAGKVDPELVELVTRVPDAARAFRDMAVQKGWLKAA